MSRISDLLVRQGEAQGNIAQARGAGRAATISAVAGFLPGVRAREQETQDRASQQRVTDSRLRTDEVQRAAAQGDINDQAQHRLDETQARALAAKTVRLNEWLAGLAGTPDLEQQRQAYASGRAQLISEGVLTPTDAPDFFPGASWVKSRMAMTLPAAERFKQLFPEAPTPKTREIKVRNADGSESIQIVEDTPGFTATSAAPPKPEPKKYQVTVPGPHGPVARLATEEEMARGVPEYRAPVQGPQPHEPNYLTLISPTGEQRRVTDGAEVNALLQEGWKQYDAVAARNMPTATSDAQAITQTALEQAKRLYDPDTRVAHPGIDAATGAWEMRGNVDQDAVNFNSIRDQLVAALALPNLGALKGPMSDKDVLFVKQISTRLANRRLDRAETEKAIGEAIAFLNSKLAGSAPPVVPVAPAAPGLGAGPAPTNGGRTNPFRR